MLLAWPMLIHTRAGERFFVYLALEILAWWGCVWHFYSGSYSTHQCGTRPLPPPPSITAILCKSNHVSWPLKLLKLCSRFFILHKGLRKGRLWNGKLNTGCKEKNGPPLFLGLVTTFLLWLLQLIKMSCLLWIYL